MSVTYDDRVTDYHICRRITGWLEKYIELANYYPNDWQQRKQVYDDNIKRTDVDNPEKAEKVLSNRLIVFVRALEDNPSPELRHELKEEFYKWIDATGINAKNCPNR